MKQAGYNAFVITMQEHTQRNKQTIQHLYDIILPELARHMHQHLTAVTPLFDNFRLERLIDTWTKEPGASEDTEVSIENGNVQQLGLKLQLEGFQRAGIEAFDLTKDLLFKLERSCYTVGPDKQNSWLEKEYGQRWEKTDYESITERWIEELVDAITKKLESYS